MKLGRVIYNDKRQVPVTLRDDLNFVCISEHVDRVRVIQEISETWRSSWI